ncbi:MAG: DegT/DnrJ/EryC1/StrS family aminotransferase [Proteobacteria bacterium]|nr:DegT/DnrJ/EryC1/StrS family aminotransferase [Pseudomonadota bacterium]
MSVRYPIIRPSLPARSDILADLDAVLASGMVTTSGQTRRFEQAIGEFLEVEHVVAVSSCTSGLMLALRALDVRGEAIVPSFTFCATGLAAIWAGLTPVFCDVRPDTLTVDVNSAAQAIGSATRVIMPVPVFGTPCDVAAISDLARERDLVVVYDSAQGLGARYRGRRLGGFGHAEVFSLSPTKVITAVEGGLVTTRDGALASAIRRMRDYGKSADGRDITDLGLSARFSEIHAIIGQRNVARADELIRARHQRIGEFRARLGDLPGVSFLHTPPDCQSSAIYMVLRLSPEDARCSRDQLIDRLAERGVQARGYFSPPLHRQAVFVRHAHRLARSLEVSERAANQCLTIPLYADMTDTELDEVAAEVRAAYLEHS